MVKSSFRYFNREEGKRVGKECTLHKDFYFAKHDFYLVEYGGWYIVCLVFNGELISLWKRKIIDKGTQVLPGEVISEFRKKWVQNSITDKKLDDFISNPMKYEQEKKSTKS